MTTFHIIHIVVGIWLAVANFFGIMSPSALMTNNVILGLIVAFYNLYFLYARNNVDAKNPAS